MSFDEATFLRQRGITLYIDVGANVGQTGQALRRSGWNGRIASFEPIPGCFAKLVEGSKDDPLWTAHNAAVGDLDGHAQIGVSKNLVSSSLREASDTLVGIWEPVRYAERVRIPVTRLDSVFDSIARPDDVVHLKIDTQGYERNVIEGAANALSRIDSVRMEVAVSEVYEGEMVLPEALQMMTDRHFVLIEAWPAWRHPRTGEVLHFDLLFRQGTIAI